MKAKSGKLTGKVLVMKVREGGQYVSTDIVVAIVTVCATAIVTFFATRADLAAKIARLDARLPIADYVTETTVLHNVNELGLLRMEVGRISVQLANAEIPKLKFSTGVPPDLGPYRASYWQLHQQWVSNLSEPSKQVKPISGSGLQQFLTSDGASALRSEQLFVQLASLALLVNEYNRALGELVYVYGSPVTQTYEGYPTLRNGASRASAEYFIGVSRRLLPRMKQLTAGLVPEIDDEVHSAKIMVTRFPGTADQ